MYHVSSAIARFVPARRRPCEVPQLPGRRGRPPAVWRTLAREGRAPGRGRYKNAAPSCSRTSESGLDLHVGSSSSFAQLSTGGRNGERARGAALVWRLDLQPRLLTRAAQRHEQRRARLRPRARGDNGPSWAKAAAGTKQLRVESLVRFGTSRKRQRRARRPHPLDREHDVDVPPGAAVASRRDDVAEFLASGRTTHGSAWPTVGRAPAAAAPARAAACGPPGSPAGRRLALGDSPRSRGPRLPGSGRRRSTRRRVSSAWHARCASLTPRPRRRASASSRTRRTSTDPGTAPTPPAPSTIRSAPSSIPARAADRTGREQMPMTPQ